MKKKLGLLLLTTLMLLPGCGAKEDNKVHLIILAGQSGARGKALNTDLVDGYENGDIEIIQDGLMMPNLNKIPTIIKNPEIKTTMSVQNRKIVLCYSIDKILPQMKAIYES